MNLNPEQQEIVRAERDKALTILREESPSSDRNSMDRTVRAWEMGLKALPEVERYGASTSEFLELAGTFNKRLLKLTDTQRHELEEEVNKRGKDKLKSADAVRLYLKVLDEWDTQPVPKTASELSAASIQSNALSNGQALTSNITFSKVTSVTVDENNQIHFPGEDDNGAA